MDREHKLLERMTDWYSGDPARIQHFIKVYTFAKEIAYGEGLDEAQTELIGAAALVHDIGIKIAEEKYGRCEGPLQEKEGAPEAEKMLLETGYPANVAERVSYLVGHHHTYTDIDGIDYRILVEADFLVNLFEDKSEEKTVRSVLRKIFVTRTGRNLCRTMFGIKDEIWISPLYKGRPEDVSGRTPEETAVYDLLDKLNIMYERVDHEVTPSIESCHGVDEKLDIHICKNLFLCNRQKTDFYLLLMPGEKPFRTKDLSKQLGCARLSFADAEHMEQYLHIHPGAVSIMGLMNDTECHVRLLVDREVLETEYIGFHPCVNTSSLKAKSRDIFEKFLPAVGHEMTVVEL